MAVEITWLGHASFRLAGEGGIAYIDPWKLSDAHHDADVVFVSHSHFDHCSGDDVAVVARQDTPVLAPADTVGQFPTGKTLLPDQEVTVGCIHVRGVRAYNVNKEFHPKSHNWLGAVFTLGGVSVYYAGDTDRIPEMAHLQGVDVALLPVGGTYTMTAAEAAAAAGDVSCRIAVPYHWGDIVGARADAEAFVSALGEGCEGRLVLPGRTISV